MLHKSKIRKLGKTVVSKTFTDQKRIKGVVAVPVKTACYKAIGQNKRPRKPKAIFRDPRFFQSKVSRASN